MKQRRLMRFHGLRRPRVRQTWNKYNLYNLARLRTPSLNSKTFFQQKWIAKSLTRGYHGEHIKEHQWERMFSRRLLSAVNMDPRYMARYDGSEQGAGRGSGLKGMTDKIKNPGNLNLPTPYMQMTFAPQERRLDIAIFRACFASSARQARQFVLHGAVTVNGKRMRHPQYLLNPGDMFQVNIERVMTATGKPKPYHQAREAEQLMGGSKSAEGEEGEGEEAESKEEEIPAEAESTPEDREARRKEHLQKLADLKKRTKAIIEDKATAKQKKQLRGFIKELNKAIQQAASKKDLREASELQRVEAGLAELFDTLSLTPAERHAKEREKAAAEAKEDSSEEVTESASTEPAAAESSPAPSSELVTPSTTSEPAQQSSSPSQTTSKSTADEPLDLSSLEKKILARLLREERENPYDPTKPYKTPWEPKPWMSPFVFIPRYLEVNQRICAAVYLRHPVARPGRSEVPSPFSNTLAQLAFNWYLKRR